MVKAIKNKIQVATHFNGFFNLEILPHNINKKTKKCKAAKRMATGKTESIYSMQ